MEHFIFLCTLIYTLSLSIIVLLIQWNIIGKIKVREFFYFNWIIFCMIWIIPYFEFTIFLIVLNSYHNCYLKVTFFVFEAIIVVIKVSQVVLFKKIESFLIIHIDTTMRANIINPYCYFHWYLLCLYITGYKFYYFIDLLYHCSEQQGKSNYLFQMNPILVRFK